MPAARTERYEEPPRRRRDEYEEPPRKAEPERTREPERSREPDDDLSILRDRISDNTPRRSPVCRPGGGRILRTGGSACRTPGCIG